MEVITILAVGFVCMACFLTGVRVGRGKDDPIVPIAPSIVPKKEAKVNEKEAEMERHRMNIILSNIENYDGTSRGQEDVPRGR